MTPTPLRADLYSLSVQARPRSKPYEWRIHFYPAALIGYVQAPDAEEADKETIARYGISNPQEQVRPAAQWIGGVLTRRVAALASRSCGGHRGLCGAPASCCAHPRVVDVGPLHNLNHLL
jgi:hypothetical protein